MRPPSRHPPRRPEAPPRPVADGLRLSDGHRDAIEQSHERCAALGVSPIERPDHTPLGRPDFAVVRERNLRLHDQAAPVMAMLYEQIVHSQSMVVLTDATGTIIHSVGDDDFLERASKVALRPGAVWSETAKGTNAIGTALVEETPTLVHADEHYVHANQFLTCSAAPILDPRGNILGVLDVSGDHRSYHQHTMALVKMSARMIENRWLADDHRDVLRLHFHSRVEFIGTLMEGILAVAADGRIVGANRGALEQLGLSGAALRQHTLGTLLGTSVSVLVDRFRSPLATPTSAHLGDGRCFHLLARFNWPVWTSLAEAVAATPAPAAPPPRPAPAALEALRSGDARWDRAIDQLQRVRDRAIPVLIVGESGTGKDLLARALHADSSHAARPFVAVDCATLPAATDAASLLARAGGGTLYLDGLDELPPAHQVHLLAALRDPPPGPAAAIVGATRQPLRELVDRGAFREDLFQRLNGLALRLPPLRERSDFAALAQRLLAGHGGASVQAAPEVLARLARQRWPGNVRELSNVLRTACALAAGAPELRCEHLGDDAAAAPEAPVPAAAAGGQKLDELELDAIRRAVDAAGGNISEAAKRLGVSRNTIYRRLRWKAPR